MTQLAARQVGAITIVDVPKSFMDMGRTSPQRGHLRELVTELLANGRDKIVLNLSQAVYCSHTALGELCWTFKTIRDKGGQLRLSNVPPNVRAALELVHLVTIFDIRDDEASAIQSFESAM